MTLNLLLKFMKLLMVKVKDFLSSKLGIHVDLLVHGNM